MGSNKAMSKNFALPPIVDGERLCCTLLIPNDETHISNFIGALYALTLWFNYIPDPDGVRKNKPVADVWRDIVTSITFSAQPCEKQPIYISEMDYEMAICEQLRYSDGKLQGLCCGQWVDITGQLPGSGGTNPQQPGSGTPQPAVGACQEYHATLNGNGQWLVPAPVSTGDTLTFSAFGGAAYDGSDVFWRCPDGQVYLAGNCSGGAFTSGADPLPSAPHMSLIVNIAGVYYSALTPITVPSGVSGANATVQLNDGTISDNQGSVSFNVSVCNNAIPSWSHSFDFRTGQHGFSIAVDPTSHDVLGVYVPGTGFEAVTEPSAPRYKYLQLERAFSVSSTLTNNQMLYDEVVGSDASGSTLQNLMQTNVGTLKVIPASNVTDHIEAWSGSQVANKIVYAFLPSDDAGTPGTGSITLKSVIVSGTGPDPF